MIRLMVKLSKKTHSDKVLRDKVFKIASDSKCHGYQRGAASMFYKVFDKKSSGSSVAAKSQIINLQMNFISRLLENLGDKKFIHLLERIFRVLI